MGDDLHIYIRSYLVQNEGWGGVGWENVEHALSEGNTAIESFLSNTFCIISFCYDLSCRWNCLSSPPSHFGQGKIIYICKSSPMIHCGNLFQPIKKPVRTLSIFTSMAFVKDANGISFKNRLKGHINWRKVRNFIII